MTYTDETGRKGARLRAYDKQTGEEKGAVFMPAEQSGSPMTYMAGGRQYILIQADNARDKNAAQGAAYVAFALPR